MNGFRLAVCLTATLTGLEFIASGEAFARGGAANIMNSPGYQRRLQESRGYVSNQSGSIFATQLPNARNARTLRRRHR
jgi:hypothetical protein